MKTSITLIKNTNFKTINMDRANSVRGAAAKDKVKGSIAGTHYDPTSATANRGASKKRPAPVPSGGAQRSKAGSQPSQ